jgi:hypothetical protein
MRRRSNAHLVDREAIILVDNMRVSDDDVDGRDVKGVRARGGKGRSGCRSARDPRRPRGREGLAYL